MLLFSLFNKPGREQNFSAILMIIPDFFGMTGLARFLIFQKKRHSIILIYN